MYAQDLMFEFLVDFMVMLSQYLQLKPIDMVQVYSNPAISISLAAYMNGPAPFPSLIASGTPV
jgi:hypothetical protein